MLNNNLRFLLATVCLLACHTLLQAQNRPSSRNEPQAKSHEAGHGNTNPSRTSRATKRKQPVFGAKTDISSRKSSEVRVHQTSYQYRDGVFYHPSAGSYVAGPGPAGAKIQVLPPGYTSLVVRGMPYFYFYGTFYIRSGISVYEVVTPPLGAIVYDLPLGFEKVIIENISYYVYGDTYYRAIIDQYGEVGYEVVGKAR